MQTATKPSLHRTNARLCSNAYPQVWRSFCLVPMAPWSRLISQATPNKKSANQSDAYSTLYPDTSSDSASGKSNGLRFVSPNAARNQHPARSGQTAANITILCPVSPVKTESRTVPVNATSNINRKLRHTSYAAAWLTARKLPSKPNLPLPAKLPDSTMPHGPMVLNNHNRSMPSQ